MIEILAVKPLNKGPLEASVTIKVSEWNNLIIRDCSIWKKDNGNRWVNMPSRAVDDGSGKKKYIPIVEIDGAIKSAFERALLEEYDKYVKKNASLPHASLDVPTWGQGREELPF